MRAPPLGLLAVAVLATALCAGCGRSGDGQPLSGTHSGAIALPGAEGVASIATRNTTRLGGADPAIDAAAVARAVYPGLTAASRPQAVVLVDERSWPASLAASVLASAPLGAPLLYADGDSLPEASAQALGALRPVGAHALGDAQVIELGSATAVPDGYRTRTVPASGDPASAAAGLEALLAVADGAPPRRVIVLAAEAPAALQMPAAGLSAESGAPILFVTAAGVPAQTAAVLARLHRPAIYVIDPALVGGHTLEELAHFGALAQISPGSAPGAESPVENAIAVARFTEGSFGWGVKEPGHGLVFANAARPLDGPASALLSASGDYGPLLLLASSGSVPRALAAYLNDLQPAAPGSEPVRGVYNHGWLIGNEHAISALVQVEIDSMLEIAPSQAAASPPSQASSEEPAESPAE
jgi:hypothetical protein